MDQSVCSGSIVVTFNLSSVPSVNQWTVNVPVCRRSTVVTTLDCGPAGPWFTSEWVPRFYLCH